MPITILETLTDKSFSWIPDISRLKEISNKGKGKILLVEGIHPMTTDPFNTGHGSREWTREQVMKSTYTAIGKGLNINHEVQLNQKYQHVVVDGEFNTATETAEYVVYEEDPEIIKLVREGYIDKVSMQGDPRRQVKKCDRCGTSECTCRMVPEGVIFGSHANESMAYVVTKDGAMYGGKPIAKAAPGDWNSSITIAETNRSKYPWLIEASDCVQACIRAKADKGMEIDDQALAICYSECGQSRETVSSLIARHEKRNRMPAITVQQLGELITSKYPKHAKLKESLATLDKVLVKEDLNAFNEAMNNGNALEALMILGGEVYGKAKEQNGGCPEGEHMVDGKCVPIAKAMGEETVKKLISETMDAKLKEAMDKIRADWSTDIKSMKESMGNLSKQVQETIAKPPAKPPAVIVNQPQNPPMSVEKAREIINAHIR